MAAPVSFSRWLAQVDGVGHGLPSFSASRLVRLSMDAEILNLPEVLVLRHALGF